MGTALDTLIAVRHTITRVVGEIVRLIVSVLRRVIVVAAVILMIVIQTGRMVHMVTIRRLHGHVHRVHTIRITKRAASEIHTAQKKTKA